jgi:hypothetical protein
VACIYDSTKQVIGASMCIEDVTPLELRPSGSRNGHSVPV